jgi:hypothetical protein
MSARRSAIWFALGLSGGVFFTSSPLVILGLIVFSFALGYRSGIDTRALKKVEAIGTEPVIEYIPPLEDMSFYSGHGFNRKE